MLLAAGFAAIYVPVIASEEKFLRATFPEFDSYCCQTPRFLPRLTPARYHEEKGGAPRSGFSFGLYLKHREYNALLGAALLYLSLLYLSPVLETILHLAR